MLLVKLWINSSEWRGAGMGPHLPQTACTKQPLFDGLKIKTFLALAKDLLRDSRALLLQGRAIEGEKD